jgi:hypothetical protein
LFEEPNALQALWRILLDISNDATLAGIYLMIDALDECESGLDDLLKLITNTAPGLSPKIKWLVSSRNQTVIYECLKPGNLQSNTSLELNSSHVSCAVKCFIDCKVRELAERKTYDEDLEEYVRDSFYEKADGTFLWVALMCKELEKIRKRNTRRTLERLPSGLEPLYERMVQQIECLSDRDDSVLCKQILLLVVLAYRPLHLAELVIADLPNHLCDDLESLQELVELCGSLLIVRDDTVYFVHQSAKDYFTTGAGLSIFPQGQAEEHCKITCKSLVFMAKILKKDMLCLHMPGALVSEAGCDRVDTHLPKYVQYVCCYWTAHLSQASAFQRAQIGLSDDGKIHKFLQEHFLHWLEVLSLLRKMSDSVQMAMDLEKMLMVRD